MKLEKLPLITRDDHLIIGTMSPFLLDEVHQSSAVGDFLTFALCSLVLVFSLTIYLLLNLRAAPRKPILGTLVANWTSLPPIIIIAPPPAAGQPRNFQRTLPKQQSLDWVATRWLRGPPVPNR